MLDPDKQINSVSTSTSIVAEPGSAQPQLVFTLSHLVHKGHQGNRNIDKLGLSWTNPDLHLGFKLQLTLDMLVG